MATCATCGNDLGIGRFCTNCGTPVSHGVAATAQFERVPPVVPDAEARPHREVPRWLPWLLGWLLLAVIAAMVGWAFGSDEGTDPGATGSSSTGPANGAQVSPDPVTVPAEASDISATATAAAPETAPPNQDLDGKAVTYDAVHMLDGDPSTAWRMPGDGTGVVLTFTLPGPTRIASVGLVNGYAKVDGPVNWYPRNRRITSVTWGFDDGSTLEQDLIDSPAMQTVGIDDVVTSSVTLTLTTVSEPGARDGRDFTPVSDVRLIGSAD